MDVNLFDFDLPRTLIAERPVSPRDAARLLHVQAGGLTDGVVGDLPRWLRPGDLLISNDTRVIPARLFGRKGEGGIELTLHERTSLDEWKAFARPAKKLRPGDEVRFADDFSATVAAKGEAGEVLMRFDRGGDDLMLALDAYGRLPLPPYIRKGEADERDRADYQTVFAREKGAVAAPTAGLHFTDALLTALESAGVTRTTITLHVGAGTFLPVKVDDTKDHRMHAERGVVTAEVADLVNRTKAAGGRVVAVGTTSLRLLESAADDDGVLHPFDGPTDIFITPGYRFRLVDVLMTNFHLPKSTLFMLVSAFAGLDRMHQAYAYAMNRGYRFYSYGDACLLERENPC
ncbi:tRNA preQ1(34) S-adenosylmethionine ribosyltransferase-isomerase QueA [Magnetospirillum gryphiswaldense]|uniref:S-adenosylmethionine:tRNA ribosyltransferase-isomerase n=1 Tax=Magnetospirillum gryphiswaldense TaxID=55518 RepID=A4U390_9PROT|nr:tRNA preQ1(34) S-adenosylmethionine ribosyltransferase-isomerase QueA [Magnetospirillum gryphiswaldense]AVM75867.1 S-adenosylmethionine:tRNA ribosyltransferase-isomerase [Magnetospirillum gryphiswaldense MSR-1]AVM79770.1 S-adenosylmethionine:tRNA ribosyltransferase-isomerase [Magnetospirillum gryphiswaldense]CAM77347.1 Queuosine biosynthesis protein [Magnetospirillum gryphiswaldense MSR-1]